jgi:hypothetical protein
MKDSAQLKVIVNIATASWFGHISLYIVVWAAFYNAI